MKKVITSFCLLAISFSCFSLGLYSASAAETDETATSNYLEGNDALTEMLGDFEPRTRAYVESVPNIADQILYNGRDWSSLLNIQWRSLSFRNGYTRSFYERKASSYVFPNHRRYYWAFTYQTY